MMRRWPISSVFFLILLSICQACLPVEQDRPEQILSKARVAFTQARYLEAERLYEDYLQTAPEDDDRIEAWTRLAKIAENVRNDPEAAVSMLETAILEYTTIHQKEPADLLVAAAVLYEYIGQWDKALDLNHRLLRIKDLPPLEIGRAQQRKARAQQAMGQYDSAQASLLACIETSREDEVQGACQLSLVRNVALTSDEQRAKQILQKVLEDGNLPDETRAIATFNLADIFERAGDGETSKKLFHSILEIYPNRPVVEARLNNLK